jgi:hypothetical protein
VVVLLTVCLNSNVHESFGGMGNGVAAEFDVGAVGVILSVKDSLMACHISIAQI